MTSSTSWPAPAKLNLFLHVTGRRQDGYHLLQTVFQFLDYADVLTFDISDDGLIQRNYELNGVRAEEDLIMRAATLLQTRCNTKQGTRITLDKQLPMGGGIGGGSSDAATTLIALNHLWQCQLTLDELAKLGIQLGADVPVFIYGHAAWAEGVGEDLTAVELPEPYYVILVPSVNVSTAEIFSDPELIRDCPPITIRDFLAGRAGNVCESLARNRFPEIDRALRALQEYGSAHLTGTGACVFAAFDSEAEARQVQTALENEWHTFVSRGRNQSPLHQHLAEVTAQD